MRRFVVAAAIPWAGVLAFALRDNWAFAAYMPENFTLLSIKLFVVPIASTWVAFEAWQLLRPARSLDPKAHRPIRPAAYGMLTGLLSVGLTIVTFALGAPGKLDTVILGSASACATSLVLLALRRVRTDRCVRCDYSTLGLSGPRCPECGTFFD